MQIIKGGAPTKDDAQDSCDVWDELRITVEDLNHWLDAHMITKEEYATLTEEVYNSNIRNG